MRSGVPGVRSWVVAAALCALPAGFAVAGDWPQWRFDAGHTAASLAALPDRLQLHWTRQETPRQPVWEDPLTRDQMPYDRIFEPVVADGRMFLSFNDADKVVAWDAGTGEELWSFYADGPVRLPPAVHGDAVLFVSDDGHLYCVAVADGTLRWRFRGGPTDRRVIGNHRLVSAWPARGGPVVDGDTVYFAASIWPFMGTFLYALDARTGEVRWRNEATADQFQKQPHSAPAFAGVAPQGQLAVAGELLLVPGGRTLPAGLDRATGQLKFFSFGGKGQGGSFVAADAGRAFVHTRDRGTTALVLPQGTDSGFLVNEPVLAGSVLYTASGAAGAPADAAPRRIQAYGAKNTRLWELDADGTGDLILAGNRLYAAGESGVTAIDLPRGDRPAAVAWTLPVEGGACRLVAAAERLFAVTLDGRILAFGEEPGSSAAARGRAEQPIAPTEEAASQAERMLATVGSRQGYALWFGLEDERLLEAVVAASELHVVGVDPDPARVDRLRRRFDRAGWYGRRIALQVGSAESFAAPPYMAQLVYVERSAAGGLRDSRVLAQRFETVRPYGGTLWISCGPPGEGLAAEDLTLGQLADAELSTVGGSLVLSRPGSLPGAGRWTHAYGDVANTVKSDDRRVRLPLGLLWFGGSSNEDILPRHGHGPSPQVLGGRVFVQGMNSLSAWDVYTGRVLWKREFEDLGTFQVYYDESYANTPLSSAYNQLHIPGANLRGTNYVATDEGVYLAIRDRCLLLDPADGRTLREFVLPADADGRVPEWGYIGVYENLLLAGTGFADYSKRLGYNYTPEAKRGVSWSPDRAASRGLLAFERQSGSVLWRIEARHSFLHNGIVAGGGRIYLLDRLPQRVEEQLARRGTGAPGGRLLAIEARTAAAVWTSENDVFGTWLSYSAARDLLVQAGAAASDRSPDETQRGLSVHRASDGSALWRNLELDYAGPCILHGDTLITNAISYRESQGAFHLLDGAPVCVTDPVTGAAFPWKFSRTYGCNTAVASEHLLTFRSGAAGFYDLSCHGGTGNLGGFRSGCTSNLIVADGVLCAPESTRTCSCSYQNQTSLALVPMPENEFWTFGPIGRTGEGVIRRLGINFGAPGDRLSEDGTWWVNYPPDEGLSPSVTVELEGEPRWMRAHSARVAAARLPWVAASGVEGIRQLTIRLARQQESAEDSANVIAITDSRDDAEESATGAIDLTSSDLELTEENTNQTVGLRFPRVPLAAGTELRGATIQFGVDEGGDQPTRLEIRAEAVDDARPFAAEAFNISRRPVTQAAVTWEPKAWKEDAKPGADHRTPDLRPLLQEVLDRPGWKPGNAVAFIVRGSGKRVAMSAEGGRKGQPRLVLDLAPAAELARGDSPVPPPGPEGPGRPRPCLVRLTFAELDERRKPGERVFDVWLQGRPVISNLDVVTAAGGPLRSLERTFEVAIDEELEIQFRGQTDCPPMISGVEIVRRETAE